MAVALLLLVLWSLRLSEGIRPVFLGTDVDTTPFLDNGWSAQSSPRESNFLSGCGAMPCAIYEEGMTVPIPGVVSIRAQTGLPKWNPKLLLLDGDGNKIACIDMKENHSRIVFSLKHPSIKVSDTSFIPHNFYEVNEWLHFSISLKVDKTFVDMHRSQTQKNLFKIPFLCQRVQVTECGRFGYSPQFPSIQQTTDNDFPINTSVVNSINVSGNSDKTAPTDSEESIVLDPLVYGPITGFSVLSCIGILVYLIKKIKRHRLANLKETPSDQTYEFNIVLPNPGLGNASSPHASDMVVQGCQGECLTLSVDSGARFKNELTDSDYLRHHDGMQANAATTHPGVQNPSQNAVYYGMFQTDRSLPHYMSENSLYETCSLQEERCLS